MNPNIPQNDTEQPLFPTEKVFETGDRAGYRLPLQPSTAYAFNTDIPLATINGPNGEQNHIVGIISTNRDGRRNAETDEFAIIDLRNTPYRADDDSSKAQSVYKQAMGRRFPANVQFLIVGRDYVSDPRGHAGFKAIRYGESVVVGREAPKTKDRFKMGDLTSREHFVVSFDDQGNLEVADLNSSNGTAVKTATPLLNPQERQRAQEQRQAPPRIARPRPEAQQPPRTSLHDELINIAGRVPGYKQRLDANRPYEFDLSRPLGRHSTEGLLTAVINADGQPLDAGNHKTDGVDKFALIDLRQVRLQEDEHGRRFRQFGAGKLAADVEFILIGSNYDAGANDTSGFKGIRRGETITIGRRDPQTAGRFKLGEQTSGQHFTISLDHTGTKMTVTDNGSTNGTNVKTSNPLKSLEKPAPPDPELERLRRIMPNSAFSDELRREVAAHVEKASAEVGNEYADIKKRLLKIIAREMHPDRGGRVADPDEYDRRVERYTAAVLYAEAKIKEAENKQGIR